MVTHHVDMSPVHLIDIVHFHEIDMNMDDMHQVRAG